MDWLTNHPHLQTITNIMQHTIFYRWQWVVVLSIVDNDKPEWCKIE